MTLLPLLALLLSVANIGCYAKFTHPGMSSTADDFARITAQVAAGNSPWKEGWNNLETSQYASSTYRARPLESVCRGLNAGCTENYANLFRDAAAAYQLALRWKISTDVAYGKAATDVLNAWSTTMKNIAGSSDRWLLAGIQGYQLAEAAEILRDFDGFSTTNLTSITNLLRDVFYPVNAYFLDTHGGNGPDHYWANWDLCNMASVIAIGILSDDQAMYNKATEYFKSGVGEGMIENLVWKIHEDGLGQIQESGRDQGHATLDIALVGAFAQMAYNQGDDLFAYRNNRILAGSEYVAKYNLGYDVSFTPYVNDKYSHSVISATGRGTVRPIWDLLYYHYEVIKGIPAPYTKEMALRVRNGTNGADAGGGSYGPNSGGFDQLGFTTLLYAQDHIN